MHDWPDWLGEIAVVCASGPSLTREDIEASRGCRVVVTNESWRLAPRADVLYGCDYQWWKRNGGVPEFRGRKFCQKKSAAREGWGIEWVQSVKRDVLFVDDEKRIGWGGNSGFQALNLAIQFGARRIALLGFDMRIDRGLHWHEDHEGENPLPENVERWRKVLDGQAGWLRKNGVEVINCTSGSALTAYPVMAIAEALEAWA